MKDNYVVPESNSVEVEAEAIVCSSTSSSVTANRSDYGDAEDQEW